MDAASLPGGHSRKWFVFAGIFSVLVGVIALAAPVLFSDILVQFLGALLLVSGVFSLFAAAFGKHQSHRVLSALTAVIRIAAGLALFVFTVSGVVAITLVLAAFFLLEGIVCVLVSFSLRPNPAWIWLLLNGIVALVLSGMIFSRWPVDSAWIPGVLYGIQALAGGATLLMIGAGAKTHA